MIQASWSRGFINALLLELDFIVRLGMSLRNIQMSLWCVGVDETCFSFLPRCDVVFYRSGNQCIAGNEYTIITIRP
jgi:hypothetical protein